MHPPIVRRLLVLLLPLLAAGALLAVQSASPTGAADPGDGPIFECDGWYTGITVKHVRVRPGDTCVLRDSVVTGGLLARNPRTVRVLDTEVRRNLMVRGATDDVTIGNEGCRLDPVVGNNITVTRSHDVAICWMTVKNNIRVTGNDGRISLFHNDVGRNITIARNLEYVRDPGVEHARPGAIRVKENVAGGHITAADNPGRQVIGGETNTPVLEFR